MYIDGLIKKYEGFLTELNEILKEKKFITPPDSEVFLEKRNTYESILEDLLELRRIEQEKEVKRAVERTQWHYEQMEKAKKNENKFDELLLDVYIDLAKSQAQTNSTLLKGMHELKAENERLKGLIK